jgi:hypothetical protein
MRQLHSRLGVAYMATDLLKIDGVAQVFSLCHHPAFIFCDNGQKEMEFVLCRPHLRAGDIIAVHDYGTEFNPRRPEIVVAAAGLRPWEPEGFSHEQTLLGMWSVP